MLDQAVKYLEDMQDDFDFRYKTLQLRGEPVYDRWHLPCHPPIVLWHNKANNTKRHIRDDFWYENTLWYPVDPVERNSVTMKQEVTTLQEILNRLDFKRKVSVSLHVLFYFLCSHFLFFLFVKGFVYLDCIVLFEPRWELPASDR